MNAQDIQVVSFDCSQTLLADDWNPVSLAVDTALELGIPLKDHASDIYRQMIGRTRARYVELNKTRDTALCDAFWDELVADWLESQSQPRDLAVPLMERARERIFGPTQDQFRLFEDTIPTLEGLTDRGYKLIVLSNWDVTLHRVLEDAGIKHYFEHVIASLEEGVEKPEPDIFHIAQKRVGVPAGSILHVGDNPLDDLRGARSAGWHGVVIDRTLTQSANGYMHDMRELLNVLSYRG